MTNSISYSHGSVEPEISDDGSDLDVVARQSYYKGYEDGAAEAKSTILYEILSKVSENPSVKANHAQVITELFKIVSPS